VGFVVEKVALKADFIRVLQFPMSIFIPPYSSTSYGIDTDRIVKQQKEKEHSRLAFDMCLVRISSGIRAILTEEFQGSSQSLDANVGIALRLGNACFLPSDNTSLHKN
jgi:hypothetical protein